jgi:glucose dehydrogenase
LESAGLHETPDLLRAGLVDVVIVGSGVAGALMGWRLAESGLQVTILEAGPRIDRQESVERFRASVKKGPDSPYPRSDHAPSPRTDDLESHFRQAGPELFMGIYQRLIGGTTWHWLGTALRLLPEDFKLKTTLGVGVDWPIDYAELEPWYGKAEVCLGVSGDSELDLGSPRSSSYPLPPIPTAVVDAIVNRAGGSLQVQARPLPQARNSKPYQGRPRCCGAASCIPICPIGAKYDAGVHVKLAEAAGAEVLHDSVVTGFERGSDRRVRAVRVVRADGSEFTVQGRIFVLAAHAVETPRLLLHSELANSSDQVGRNLMGGSAQMSWCLATEPVFPYRAPQATSGFFDFRGGSERTRRSGFLTTISTDGWPGGAPTQIVGRFLAKGLKGRALREAVADHVSRQVALVSTCEQLPQAQNRVTLARNWPDSSGVPRPRVEFRSSEYTNLGLVAAKDFHQKLFDAMKGEEQNHAIATDPAYILGTTRMGDDPAESVVDRDLVCHDHPNLLLVGSGVFPTTGTSPPTLTVAALALRAAAHVRGLV